MQPIVPVLLLAALCAAPAWPQVPLNAVPSRAVGHPQLAVVTVNPNLVEGRELYSPQSVALDTSQSPPAVYVSDTGNNRVLAWKNALQFNNGQPADLIIGQRDRFSTTPMGPGTNLSTGLSSPTGLVMRGGALYVADSGNNRVLRFPAPLAQTDQLMPDLVIGQVNLTSRAPNQGLVGPNEKTIYLAGNAGTFTASMVFDSAGNLYLTDPGNRRVLRYPASSLSSNAPAADLVLGQLDFTSQYVALAANDPKSPVVKGQFAVPSGLAFDTGGRLYVSDSDPAGQYLQGRVLVFTPPLFTGASARRIMGLVVAPAPGQPPVSQVIFGKTQLFGPNGLQVVGGSLMVADAGNHRILLFDPYDQWPDEATTYSPQAKYVFGQNYDWLSYKANNGQARPSPLTFAVPVAMTMSPDGRELFVVDSGNHRVIAMPYAAGLVGDATRVLGQDRLDTGSPNLIEGREFQFAVQTSQGTVANAAIAIDTKSDPPHLYVADTYNHRILGFNDLRNLKPGDKADLVLGQPDMQTAMCNYPAGTADKPTQSSLCWPMGLLVDSDGSLYVADSGNGRVLRFPAPFARQAQLQAADLVLGQSNFTIRNPDPSAKTMGAPYGLAFVADVGLLVSDSAWNRALFFPTTGEGLASGMAATKVIGQPDYISIVASGEDNRFRSPGGVSSDTDGRPYIADMGNSRVLIYDNMNRIPAANGRAAVTLPGVSAPKCVFVSALTGEIWVTDTNANRALRYVRFDQLQAAGFQPKEMIYAPYATLAVAQDQYGDLYLADATNRVAMYYPGLAAINGASFLVNRPLAPGVIASLYPATASTFFGSSTKKFDELPNPLPLPTTLADIQLTVNGTPAPLFFVSPTQINFMVPMSAPDNGTADVLVTRQSTGQILGAGPIALDVASPALFTADSSGRGQIAVINQDGKVNSAANPAARGSIITIFGTGQGKVDGAPPDGTPPTGPVPTPEPPRIVIGTCYVDDTTCSGDPTPDAVQYSGLAPGFPGLWQINVRVPHGTTAPYGSQVGVGVVYRSRNSQPGAIIAVK